MMALKMMFLDSGKEGNLLNLGLVKLSTVFYTVLINHAWTSA